MPDQYSIKKSFFSIIIPAHNSNRYISDILQDIMHQTCRDFELIIVDDGSTDDTLDAIDKTLTEDFKDEIPTRIIHLEPNRGAAEARNKGLDIASGTYTIFLDADDSISHELLAKVKEAITGSEMDRPELAVYGIREQYIDKQGKVNREKEIIPAFQSDKTEALKEYIASNDKSQIHQILCKLEEQTLYGYLWNKAYLTVRIKELGLKIPKLRILEDINFNIDYCMDLGSLIVLGEPLYIYKKRGVSETSKPIPDYYDIHRDRMRRLYEQYNYWGILNRDSLSGLSYTYTRYLYSALVRTPACKRKGLLEHIYADQTFKDLIEGATLSGGSPLVHIMHYFLRCHMDRLILFIASLISLSSYGRDISA